MRSFNFLKYSSILDVEFQELLLMDFVEVKDLFVKEIRNFNELDRFSQERFIKKLFRLQNNGFKLKKFLDSEHRFYFDLISSLCYVDTSYFLECLHNYEPIASDVEKKQISLLAKILEFYDNHELDEIKKFNYVFRSSFDIYDKLDVSKFDLYFNSRVMKKFDKETLSQLYRENFSFSPMLFQIPNLLEEKNHKSLYMISLMAKKIKNDTGHNAEFLKRILNYVSYIENDLLRLLSSFYDYYVGDISQENNFKEKFLEENNYLEFDEIIRIVLDVNFYRFPCCRETFINMILNDRNRYHYFVFNSGALDKISNNTFDKDIDFKEIISDIDLENFKRAVLFNVYGITPSKARIFIKKYGLYLDELEKDVKDSDLEILSILKAIKNICSLKNDDKEKIRALQLFYYDKVKENGLDNKGKYYSFFILESLFNRMIINTYNENLLNIDELMKIGDKDGVNLYDSGLNFDIILTSLAGVGDFFESDVNMKSKWNTSYLSGSHGLSCSHINHENLGVISFKSIFLGFNHIPEYSLNLMGVSDIFSTTGNYDLRNKYASDYYYLLKYLPVSVLPNESRYGYNELLIDRFLMNDKDNILKLQPDYIVYFKFDEEYENDSLFNNSLKVAKDFDIPIVIVDVMRIKEKEKIVIDRKIEQLLDVDECDCELLKEIVVRYMNNYTGSLTMVGSSKVNYNEDFSVKGMEEFFDKVIAKVLEVNDFNKKRKWYESLVNIYLDEKRKYDVCTELSSYGHSVKEFILDTIGIREKIYNVNKIQEEQRNCENKIVVELLRALGEDAGLLDSFKGTKDKEMTLIEKLLVSYFFEDCSGMVVNEVMDNNSKRDCSFKTTEEFDFVSDLREVCFDEDIFESFSKDKLNTVLEKVETMSDKDFLNIFSMVIENYSSLSGKKIEDVACNLLDKKNNVRSEFIRLQNSLNRKKDILGCCKKMNL